MITEKGQYLDIKQKSRPVKRAYKIMHSRPRGLTIKHIDNSPVQMNKNQTQRTSASRQGGSKERKYASTKGFTIKTKTRTYEQR